MNKKFSGEKLISITLISIFCVITLFLAFKIHSKINDISLVPAVVIHDIPTTSIEERDKAIVYITASGNKYHTENCIYLNESKIAITKEEAKNSGYESCSKCQP